MAVPFIFWISIIILLFLVLSFIIKVYALGMISAIAMIVIGVFILANDMEGISNTLTLALGMIFVCLGVYIFINGSIERLQEAEVE